MRVEFFLLGPLREPCKYSAFSNRRSSVRTERHQPDINVRLRNLWPPRPATPSPTNARSYARFVWCPSSADGAANEGPACRRVRRYGQWGGLRSLAGRPPLAAPFVPLDVEFSNVYDTRDTELLLWQHYLSTTDTSNGRFAGIAGPRFPISPVNPVAANC